MQKFIIDLFDRRIPDLIKLVGIYCIGQEITYLSIIVVVQKNQHFRLILKHLIITANSGVLGIGTFVSPLQ